jgi:hypothetical protein
VENFNMLSKREGRKDSKTEQGGRKLIDRDEALIRSEISRRTDQRRVRSRERASGRVGNEPSQWATAM